MYYFVLYMTCYVLSIHNILFILQLYIEVIALYKRIKDLREDNDKKQIEIAKILDISQQYYSEYEKGNRPIPVEKLRKLALLYNTSIDYIVELTDEKSPYKRSSS